MITTLEGLLGAGKTLTGKYFVNLAYKDGYTIYSNINFTDIPFINVEDIQNLDSIETNKNIFLLDEAYLSADSRNSTSKKNIAITNLILQSRKKKIDFILTYQLFSSIDIRIRYLVDYRIVPKITKWLLYPNDLDEYGKPKKIPLSVKLTKLDVSRNKINTITIPDVRHILNTYDTYEIAKGMDTKSELEALILHYAGYEGTKTDLRSKLILEHDTRPQDAKNISDYIIGRSKEDVFKGLGYEIPKENIIGG